MKAFQPEFDAQVAIITEEILKTFDPISIYLIGSFGRGEGALNLLSDPIRPFRDYDILVIVERKVRNETIRRVTLDVHRRLGLPNPFSKRFVFKDFVVWITQARPRDLNALPLLKYFELKEASKLLWGKDIRESIKTDFQRVSLYNGVLILFSKMEGLLGLLDLNRLKESDNIDGVVDLAYECYKTYVEFGTCLNILAGTYLPSFAERCAKISEDFGSSFPELEQLSDSLSSRMLHSCSKRLLIDREFLKDLNIGHLLNSTVSDLRIVIWYYLRKAYGTDSPYNPTFFLDDTYLQKLDTKVLEDLFNHFIKSRLGFCSTLTTKLSIKIYLRYTLLKFFWQSRKAGIRVRFRVLYQRNGNMMIRLWWIALAILSSVKQDLTIDANAFEIAKSKFSEIVDWNKKLEGANSSNPQPTFNYVKETTSDLLSLADKLFHQKG